MAAAAAVVGGLALADARHGGEAATPRAIEKGRPGVCDHFASPEGNDRSRGTLAAPFRTVSTLVVRLKPGQTGCLLAGVYEEDVTIRRGGEPGKSITLRAAPGDHPKLVGRVVIADSANDLVVKGLVLDGRNDSNLPSPTILGDRIQFLRNNVTNEHAGICFDVGSDHYGVSEDVLIAGNRVHDCGQLPPTNHEHGIYVSFARNVVIRSNFIYANADRGIQLYPSAQDTLIEGNVIDGNGEGIIFAGDDRNASSNNIVRNNIISNSVVRYNVESYWEGVVGTGNAAKNNCLWNGAKGNVEPDRTGFVAEQNLIVDPQFVNRNAKNFQLQPGSKCATVLATAGSTAK